MEEIQEKQVIVKEKSNKETLFKLIVSVFFVLFWTILIYIKIQNENFKIGYFILIGVIITIVGLIFFFGFSIYRKYQNVVHKEKDEEKLPPSTSIEALKLQIESLLQGEEFRNHVKRYLSITPHNVNKNLIYDFEIEPLYVDNGKDRINIIINSHYPERFPAIKFNATKQELYRVVNDSSINPEPPVQIERNKMWNPLTQTFVETEKKTPTKHEEKEKPKEDLA